MSRAVAPAVENLPSVPQVSCLQSPAQWVCGESVWYEKMHGWKLGICLDNKTEERMDS